MSVRSALSSLALLAIVAAIGCYGGPGTNLHTNGHNIPPAARMMEPGPGVGGPGPGVLAPMGPPAGAMVPGGPMGGMGMPMDGMVMDGMGPEYCPPGMGGGVMQASMRYSQVLFAKPEGMQVRWDTSGQASFDSTPLVVPGRQNFPQGGIYRLKLTNVPAREGVELYPTVEIGPATPRTEAFLAHNAIPIQITEEDLDQVLTGNFVTKVIYLPDPEFQELALAGVETLVSTRLDPGVDPIVEADRRGAILAILRLGNKDIEMPGEMGEGVIPAQFHAQLPENCPLPMGPSMIAGPAIAGPMMPGAMMPGAAGPTMGTIPQGTMYGNPVPGHISGVTTPEWGMPISGTPIGLPGPPHVPLGVPAGLKKHTMRNHTYVNMPQPTRHVGIHVKQTPGMSYPTPPSRVHIHESAHTYAPGFSQPYGNMHQVVPGGNGTPVGGAAVGPPVHPAMMHGAGLGYGGLGQGAGCACHGSADCPDK